MRQFVAIASTATAVLAQAPAAAAPAAEPANRPVAKVIKLLNEMKSSLEKEITQDQELYEKMECWCKTNDGAKTKAIEAAEEKIEQLESSIEQATGLIAKLESEIKGLTEDVASDNKAVAEALEMRKKELEAFEQEKAEMEETIDSLSRAVDALSKHNALNQVSFVQLRSLASNVKFSDMMRKDLWDVLGSVQTTEENNDEVRYGFLQAKPSNSGGSDVLVDDATLYKETMAKEAEDARRKEVLKGGAAKGAKSYNSRSGQIFGVLSQMKEDFEMKLAKATKEEAAAAKQSAQMVAALREQIAAAKASKKSKKQQLGDTSAQMQKDKKDKKDTTAALSADEQFLMNLKKKCAQSDEEYNARQKSRTEEISAVGEAIGVLTDDESRDLFSRNFNFVQVDATVTSKAQQVLRAKAAKKILSAAKKQGNYAMAALAISVKLDGFTKVKKAMDEMHADLKAQQLAEYELNDSCKKDLNVNEDTTRDRKYDLKNTESTIADLETQIATLTQQIDVLNVEVADTQTSIKAAGEDRAAENKEYQTTVNDQRLTVNILNKALAKLASFYEPQEKVVSAPQLLQQPENKAGRAVGDKQAPQQMTYDKQGAAPGVMGLIQMIIKDAEAMDAEATRDEQNAQASYEQFVKDANASIKASQDSVSSKTEERASSEISKNESNATKTDLEKKLEVLAGMNAALHTKCDFTLRNYEVNQQARADEMNAIQEAKAVLSGANFA